MNSRIQEWKAERLGQVNHPEYVFVLNWICPQRLAQNSAEVEDVVVQVDLPSTK